MRHNKIKAYWLLLPALLITGAMTMSVGTAYARYATTVTSVAVIDNPAKDLHSNCLAGAQEAPRIVALGQLEAQEMTVPFWLQASGGDAAVNIRWSVADDAYSDLLTAAVSMNGEALSSGQTLELPGDTRVDLVLRLAATEAANAQPHPARTVDVQVTVADAMEGTFQVTLPGVAGPDGQIPAEQPETPAQTAEVTEPAGETQATEPSEPTEPTQPTEPAPPALSEEEQEALMALKTIPGFRDEEQLPVLLVLAEHITSVRFGTQGENGLSALPDYTMFSLDGGESYTMIYGNMIPEFPVEGVSSLPVLLDLRYAAVDPAGELKLAMEAYKGTQLRKTCAAATVSLAPGQWQSVPLYEPLAAEGEQAQLGSPILTFENMLEFSFPLAWEESQIDYTVEILTLTQEQKLAYVPVTLSEDGMDATYHKAADSHKLTVRLGQKFSQAGTYRIRITWNYEGICYSDTHTTFLVNCLGRRAAAPSGQEVAHDE